MAREKFQTLTEQMFYILLCLRREQCGADIMARVAEVTQGRVTVGPGTLYNLLEQFLAAGYIRETKVEGRRRSYLITEGGAESPGGRVPPAPAADGGLCDLHGPGGGTPMKDKKRALMLHSPVRPHLHRPVSGGPGRPGLAAGETGALGVGVPPGGAEAAPLYAVTYFPPGLRLRPRPQLGPAGAPGLLRRRRLELVTTSGQMQIFVSEAENPPPVETDPEVQVANIHRAHEAQLPAQLTWFSWSFPASCSPCWCGSCGRTPSTCSPAPTISLPLSSGHCCSSCAWWRFSATSAGTARPKRRPETDGSSLSAATGGSRPLLSPW